MLCVASLYVVSFLAKVVLHHCELRPELVPQVGQMRHTKYFSELS